MVFRAACESWTLTPHRFRPIPDPSIHIDKAPRKSTVLGAISGILHHTTNLVSRKWPKNPPHGSSNCIITSIPATFPARAVHTYTVCSVATKDKFRDLYPP